VSTIVTDGLTKAYGRQRGIEDLTMTVEPGEIYGAFLFERRDLAI
jgi:ABC-type multidrug transport system ATPase subunit